MSENEQLVRRLARIEGQIRGISKMLAEGRTCDDVVTQLMAVRSGVDNVGALVLDAHIQQCLTERDAEAQLAALRDSMRIWWRFAPGAGTGFTRDAELASAAEGETTG